MKKLLFTALLAVCSIARAGYDGSGNYTLPPSVPVAGQLARAAQLNSIFNDIAAALTTAYHVAGSPNTNASLLSSGTLPAARLPAFTGDCTTVIGTSLLTCSTIGGASVGLLGSANTWTGDNTFTPGSGTAVTINAASSAVGMVINTTPPITGQTALTINGNSNGASSLVLNNTSNGANAISLIDLSNGTDTGLIQMQGTGYTALITGAPNGSYLAVGVNTAQPMGLVTNLKERVRVTGAGNVIVNVPDSGTPLTVAGVAVPKSAYAQIGGSGTCAVTGGGQGVSSCSRSSAGAYVATITGFTSAPICTASASNGAVPIVLASPQSSTSVNVTTENISGTPTDTTGIQVICSGT